MLQLLKLITTVLTDLLKLFRLGKIRDTTKNDESQTNISQI